MSIVEPIALDRPTPAAHLPMIAQATQPKSMAAKIHSPGGRLGRHAPR
jgi:hypothetical protein